MSINLNTQYSQLIKKYSFVEDYFTETNLTEKTILKIKKLEEQKKDYIVSQVLTPEEQKNLQDYIEQLLEFFKDDDQVKSITIIAGNNKKGEKEKFQSLKIEKGEIIVIVGPTGSGKSRLLADIEWVAQKDTPTKRQILVNDEVPETSWRFSSSKKLVAQLSQNMNFVMDLTVKEFLNLHAESRMVENKKELVEKIIKQANQLAGEQFSQDTQITSLSGGQSRALMIADTAILSKSPIILIDEIENAGIDRQKALNLLLSEDKIVLMATHDPILALMGDKRIIIKNGGIAKIIETTTQERTILKELEELDKKLLSFREKLRKGETLAR